jgi:hypothetical protein
MPEYFSHPAPAEEIIETAFDEMKRQSAGGGGHESRKD